MNLQMDSSLAEKYNSASQKACIVTESWVAANMFCPLCGNLHISHFENNRPVADYFCPHCGNQFELKSKNGTALKKIADGAYSTMIERITSFDHPDFLFMSYTKSDWTVRNLFFVPKHFFTPGMIEKRPPLRPTARRAGWIGCNINLSQIPATGRIPIIENGVKIDKTIVIKRASAANALNTTDILARGWLLDTLMCVEKIGRVSFALSEVYAFEDELALKHPDNHNIRAKIRQQLQVLRDRGILEFTGLGKYRRVQ